MPERPLRLLIIVNHYPPDVNPSGKLMHQLTLGLRARGHTVDILTTFPHYQAFKVEPAWRGRMFDAETVPGGRIMRVWSFASGKKQRMLHRLGNYLTFNAMAGLRGLLAGGKYDVVLANSGSFFTGITAWVLGGLRRVPFIYNVQDIYPDVPVRAGQLQNVVAIRGLEQIERFMYDRAAHITVISQQQRQVLERKGVPPAKLSVISNFVDTSLIQPLAKDNEWSRRFGLHDKFVIAHAGNLGYAYDFNSLLEVARRMRAQPRVQFLLVGDGVRRAGIAADIAAAQLSNVRMLPYQPEADLPLMRASTDVQLSLYATGAVQSSLPSKIYEIMASGRPAIVAAEPDTDLYQLVNAAGCGICIEPENADQLHRAIVRLCEDPAYAAQLGAQGRAAAVKSYSREAAVAGYEQLFAALTR